MMQSDPCRLGDHAGCIQPDPDCGCPCHCVTWLIDDYGYSGELAPEIEDRDDFGYIGEARLMTPSEQVLEACYEERAAVQSLFSQKKKKCRRASMQSFELKPGSGGAPVSPSLGEGEVVALLHYIAELQLICNSEWGDHAPREDKELVATALNGLEALHNGERISLTF